MIRTLIVMLNLVRILKEVLMPSFRPHFRRVFRPGRRFARRALFGSYVTPDQNQLQDLWDWVNGMQTTVNTLVNRNGEMQNEMARNSHESGEHTDLIVDQLWRRLEASDARLASHLQNLEDDLGRKVADLENSAARMQTENAAILRLIGHEEYLEPNSEVAAHLPIAHATLFSEVERGSSDVLLHKLSQYVPYFEGVTKPVIDIGCGKGDFLELMSKTSTKAYGVDLDDDAVRMAKERGLDARLEDLFKHLGELEENSLGGAFSSQVVEHLPAIMLAQLYEELYRVVVPNGLVIIETPNPATFSTHVQSFWRDPTHTRPVPAPALDFAARSAGFVTEKTVFTSPTPENEKLQHIDLEPIDPLMAEFVKRFNANAEKLDDVLFGYQDYALVVRKV